MFTAKIKEGDIQAKCCQSRLLGLWTPNSTQVESWHVRIRFIHVISSRRPVPVASQS